MVDHGVQAGDEVSGSEVARSLLAEASAADAAVAACLVEAVALPMKCGLGGDLVALARSKGGPIRALVSVGPGLLDGE